MALSDFRQRVTELLRSEMRTLGPAAWEIPPCPAPDVWTKAVRDAWVARYAPHLARGFAAVNAHADWRNDVYAAARLDPELAPYFARGVDERIVAIVEWESTAIPALWYEHLRPEGLHPTWTYYTRPAGSGHAIIIAGSILPQWWKTVHTKAVYEVLSGTGREAKVIPNGYDGKAYERPAPTEGDWWGQTVMRNTFFEERRRIAEMLDSIDEGDAEPQPEPPPTPPPTGDRVASHGDLVHLHKILSGQVDARFSQLYEALVARLDRVERYVKPSDLSSIPSPEATAAGWQDRLVRALPKEIAPTHPHAGWIGRAFERTSPFGMALYSLAVRAVRAYRAIVLGRRV